MSLQQQRCTAAGLLPPPFRCASSRDGKSAVRVEASGELDIATTPELGRALREAGAVSPRLVMLDLDALTFIDSSGVHAIQDASLDAALQGRRLVVARAPAHVVRILALTRTSDTIDLLEVDAPGYAAA